MRHEKMMPLRDYYRLVGWKTDAAVLLTLVSLCVGVVVGASCAHPPDPLITTGQALHLADDTFVETGHLMDAAFDAHVVTLEQYRTWAKFARQFPKSYRLAWDAWEAATKVADAAAQMGALDAIAVLLGELQRFYVAVTVAFLAPADGGTP